MSSMTCPGPAIGTAWVLSQEPIAHCYSVEGVVEGSRSLFTTFSSSRRASLSGCLGAHRTKRITKV
jgi:AMMECR1 domain-containing protein